jgi:hypothetical protein
MSDQEHVEPSDKSDHIDLRLTVNHPQLGEETVLIQVHANAMLLGVIGLQKIGSNQNMILQLASQFLPKGDPDLDDDEYPSDDDVWDAEDE